MSRYAEDSDAINNALRQQPERMLDAFAPGWVERRGKGHACPHSDKDLGSLVMNLTGQYQGSWRRHSVGIGGGPIAFIAYMLSGQAGEPTKEDFRRAYEEARKFLGMGAGTIDHAAVARARDAAEARRAAMQAQRELDAETNRGNAAWVWEHAGEFPASIGEVYMRETRGIRLPDGMAWPSVLRFDPHVWHDLACEWSPAIVCRVDDVAGNFLGVWRIYVTHAGRKAAFSEPRLGLGPVGGGAIRLTAPQAGTVGLAEGVETALSVVVQSRGAVGMWSAMSTSGLLGWQAPLHVDRVLLFADPDANKRMKGTRKILPSPGITAAERLRARLIDEGIACIRQPTTARRGVDYNDALVDQRERYAT